MSATTIETHAPAAAAPANLDAALVKGVVGEYIEKDSRLKGGEFLVYDPTDKKIWKLKSPKAHEDVRNQDVNVAVVCVDMTSGKGSDKKILDVDFFVVKSASGNAEVSDIKIHKVGKKEHYIYDENNQIRPVPAKAKAKPRKKAVPQNTVKPGV